MRRLAAIVSVIAAAAGLAAASAGADDSHTYKLEMYDAFGLVKDAEVKVAGVNAGRIVDLDVNAEKRALVTVELSGPLSVLGDKTECSSQPQSLIAEYFIDCQPAGDPLPDGATVPKLVTQTVGVDLVANTLRMPYRDRLRLLINEFGTALAGNPQNLNEAIRMGAPALQDLHKALRMLAKQSKTIAQLNADSDEIIGKLAARSDDVVAFVREAGETAAASAERRDDLSRDFDLLDDALREIGPTMNELENVAVETTPLLGDLRQAAPGLTTLSQNLPGFARSTERSLSTLGDAAKPGMAALRRGKDEIEALAEASGNAFPVAEQVQLLLDDISDPRRAVEIDTRVPADTGRDNPEPGQRDTQGYTGMEGILNYFYYFAGAINQFDDVGHFLHFSLYDALAGPCGHWNAEQSYPKLGGGRTTNPLESHPCVGFLGPNQPGITPGWQEEDLGVQPYPPSVCPNGSTDLEICDPNAPQTTSARGAARGGANGGGGGNAPGAGVPTPGGNSPGTPGLPNLPLDPDKIRDQLEDLLDLPGKALDDLGLGGLLGGGKKKQKGNALGNLTKGVNKQAQELLDFLLGP